jgi:hypothetical protein
MGTAENSNRSDRAGEMAQNRDAKKIEPEAIFLQASQFHLAFRALWDWKPNHPSGAKAMHTPAAVLSAFTSELMLKTLVCIETGRVPKGHHLLNLFNDLSANTRERITELWDSYATMHADRWVEIDVAVGSPVARDLPTALRRASKTFELARYYYEEAEDFQFYLGALPDMLGRVAFELRPDWKERARQSFDSINAAANEGGGE